MSDRRARVLAVLVGVDHGTGAELPPEQRTEYERRAEAVLTAVDAGDGHYDSRPDTYAHIATVRRYLVDSVFNLLHRADVHDESKLAPPEVEAFDRLTPKLRETTYGTPEYKALLADMQDALRHHYAACSHHPEHFTNGMWGMSLFDLVEMLADWKAAGERHADGSMERSLVVNVERFGIEPQLASILRATCVEMGWLNGADG